MADSLHTDLKALRRMVKEAHLILTTTVLPEGRAERASELLGTASALAANLVARSGETTPSALGQKGGLVTAKRGSDYFRQLAARRTRHGGGRPRKGT